MKLKYVLIACLLFVLISAVSTRLLMLDDGICNNYDYTAKLDVHSFREYFFSLYKWDQTSNIDSQKRIVMDWIFLFVSEQEEQMLHFTVVVFLILFIFYITCVKFLEKFDYNVREKWIHVIAFTAAFIYLANPFCIHLFFRLTPIISYAFFPVLFYSVVMFFKSDRILYPVIFGALTAFLFLLVIHNILYIGFIFVAVAAVYLYYNLTFKFLKKSFLKLLISILVFIVLTAFTLLPVLYYSFNDYIPQPGYVNNLDYVLETARYANEFRTMTLDINIYRWPEIYYEYPFPDLFYPAMAVIFSLALASVLLRPNKLMLSVMFCFIIFVFLSKSINPPFGELYQLIIFNLPNFGWMFRSGIKFTYMVPLFLSLMIAHSLAVLTNRKLFFASVGALLAIFGIFAWPVWTGDFAEQIVKKPIDPEFLEVASMLKEDGNYNSKAAWYSDYVESSPIRAARSGKSDMLAMRNLIGTGHSVSMLDMLSDELGFNYLLIDNYPVRPYYHVAYAKNVKGEANNSFEQIYDGERFDVFELNEGTEMFYIADKTIMAYSGFNSVAPLLSENKSHAVIFADRDVPSADAFSFADALVFGLGENADINFNYSNAIPVGGNVLNLHYTEEWAKSLNGDAFEGRWLRVLESKEIYSDQWTYNHPVIFTDSIYSTEIISSKKLNPSFKDPIVRNNISDYTLEFGELSELTGNGSLSLEGRANFENVASLISVDFYDEGKQYVESAVLFWTLGTNKRVIIEEEKHVPENASYFRIRVYAASLGDNTSSFSFVLNDVSLNNYGENTFEDEFLVNQDGDYELFLRIFRNTHGGKISVSLDDSLEMPLPTNSEKSAFSWVKIYDGYLEKGTHKIRIKNIEGFNAVNIGYLREKKAMEETDKQIIYVYEENDSGIMEVYRQGIYAITPPNASISIDGSAVSNNSIFLGAGPHSFNVTDAPGYVILGNKMASESRNAEIISYERTGLTSHELQIKSDAPYFIVFKEGYSRFWRASYDGKEIEPVPVYSLITGFHVNKTGNHTLSVYYGPQPWHEAGLLLSTLGLIFLFAFIVKDYYVRWTI